MKVASDRWWVAVSLAMVMSLVWVGCDGGDLCAGVFCEAGQICIGGQCVAPGDAVCEPDCPAGEVCQMGRCVSAGGGCDYQGQACAWGDHLQWADAFLCVDWGGGVGQGAVCSENCAAQGCPSGSACFGVIPGQARSCGGSAECRDQEICHDGQCVAAVCRPSECDVTAGADSGCADHEVCGQLGSGFAICMRAGQREEGQQCLEAGRAMEEGRYLEGCVAGAICLGGTCQAFCDEGSCPEAQQCVDAPVESGQSVAVCASVCEVGQSPSGGCAADETCVPMADGRGICRQAGAIKAFERCDVGDGLCEPGTICAEEEGGQALWRCLPVCDLRAGDVARQGEVEGAGQAGRDASCPQPPPEEALWTAWHLAPAAQAVDLYVDGEWLTTLDGGELAHLGDEQVFVRRPEGVVSWRIQEAGLPATDEPLAQGSVELVAGQTALLILWPVPGRDRQLRGEAMVLEGSGEVQWIQGIPDLGPADLWALDDDGAPELWLEGMEAGQGYRLSPAPGDYQLRLVAAGGGSDGEPLVVFDRFEITGAESLIAFSGTLDGGDIHSPDQPLTTTAEMADGFSHQGLALTCRAVNGGAVGGCMERCDGLERGRCRGELMGCGPRWFEGRGQWSTVCQPVGTGGVGAICDPGATEVCGEGLFCEIYGQGAELAEGSDGGGRCAPRCLVGHQEQCADERWCRPLTGAMDYEVGECRRRCDFDGDYEDLQCPAGLQSCKPEGRLVPAGDGVSGGLEVEATPPLCWASGTVEPGGVCDHGECIAGAECLFERSTQEGFVATLLSPYFGAAGATPRCRRICDPFTEDRSDHRCGDGETCLFNYPWNASVGHCAPVMEQLSPGQACDSPGLACGRDSICVDNDGVLECLRFCQFIGGGADGYGRSSCPVGFRCAPLVADIGVCQ